MQTTLAPPRADPGSAEIGALCHHARGRVLLDLAGDSSITREVAQSAQRTCAVVRPEELGPTLAALMRADLELVADHAAILDPAYRRLIEDWQSGKDARTRHRHHTLDREVCVHVGTPAELLLSGEIARLYTAAICYEEYVGYVEPKLRDDWVLLVRNAHAGYLAAVGLRIREWVGSLAVCGR